MRKVVYKLHKYTGLTLGVLMFLLAFSGIIITFREELLPVVYKEFSVTPGETELHPEAIIRSANNYLQERQVTNFYAAGDSDEAALILFRDPKKFMPGILTMNPYTGEPIAEMPLWKNIFAVALYIHANFLIGKTGEWLVGILGFVLMLFVVSGFYIWLPKKNILSKLKLTFGKNKRQDSQKLHHQLGLILAIPLFVSALTGFLTIFDLSYYVMASLRNDPKRPEEMSLVRACDFEQDMKALSMLNEFQLKNLISIHLCGKKNALMKVSYGLQSRHPSDGYARLVIDTKKLEVLQGFDSDKDPSSWNIKRLIMYPIHSGEFFGMTGKVIVFLSGVGLMIIFVSGVLLSIRRARMKTHNIQ